MLVLLACLLVKTLLVLPIFKSLRARTVTLRYQYCMLYVCMLSPFANSAIPEKTARDKL